MAERHPTFYFDETLLVIQVENMLFKVHKYHLLQSETFTDMFKIPETPGDSVEGATPEHPIILSGIKAADFEALLRVLYARLCSNTRPTFTSSLIVSAYRLAHMWNFSDLRAYLLSRAEETLDDVGKIEFANEFDVKKWLVPAYLNLCRRSKPPTNDEATRLGVKGLLMVFRLREHYRPWDPVEASKFPNGSEKYCDLCFGYSHHPGAGFFGTGSSGLPNKCTACGKATRSWFYRNQLSSGSNSTEDTLENRLKQWVERGCEPE